MPKKIFTKFLLILILNYHYKNSRGNTIRGNIQNSNYNIEQVYGNCVEDDISETELQNLLENAIENPLNLNTASLEELETFYLLNEDQIFALQNHISKYGPLLSIYELQTIPEFDLATIQRILPFVYVDESVSDFRNNAFIIEGVSKKNNSINIQYKRKFLTKKEEQEWYKISSKTGNKKNLGSPDEILTKIRIRHPSGYDIGIAAKKSPGENFTWHNKSSRYGFNVYRGHLMLQNKNFLKKLIFGNYEVGYGQGLVNSSGFDLGKSCETVKVIKTGNLGIKPYTSPRSIKLCGIASTIQLSPWELSTYYSFVKLDQAIIFSDEIGWHVESQLSRACNYESFSKLERRNSLTEQIYGIILLYRTPKNTFEIGTNTVFNKFDIPFWEKTKYDDYKKSSDFEDENEGDEKYKNKFSGTQNIATSLFYRYMWKNIHFFGEEAISKNLSEKTLQTKNFSPAIINGAVISLHKALDTTILHRYYSPAYNCFYGNPLKENTHAKNEHAIYTGLRFRPTFSWYFDIYFDYMYIPEPNKGQNPNIYNWLAKTTYEVYKIWIVSLQYTEKIKDEKITNRESKFTNKIFSKSVMRKARLQSSYMLNPRIRLKNEIHINKHSKINVHTWGCGIIQDISYKIFDSLKTTTRVGWFTPQTHKNSIYSYEPQPLNIGRGTHQYSKRGLYFCLLLIYKPTNSWRIELKYSHMQKFETKKNKIDHNKYYSKIDNSITAQITYTF